MTDYSKLVEALRCCAGANTEPSKCPDYGDSWCDVECLDKHLITAADAISELQDTVQAQDKALEECARQLAKRGPKRGDFEKKLHDMFETIWDREIDHPIFQDTVGDLMEAVLQAFAGCVADMRKMEEQDEN